MLISGDPRPPQAPTGMEALARVYAAQGFLIISRHYAMPDLGVGDIVPGFECWAGKRTTEVVQPFRVTGLATLEDFSAQHRVAYPGTLFVPVPTHTKFYKIMGD